MGLRGRIKVDLEDFKRGFNDGWNEERDMAKVDEVAKYTVGVASVVSLGFLAALSGVPFLPWGRPAMMGATLIAGALSALNLRDRRRAQVIRALGVFVLAFAVLRIPDAPTTSMILIGAFINTASSIAKNYPFLYGLFAGMLLAVLAVKIADANVFDAQQLLLSGRPFTSDGGAEEGLRIAGFLFLLGILHLSVTETERFKTRAIEAEAAHAGAVVDERARIARELHDVVSHHVTAMTLQAEAASMTGDKTALSSVATAGREALTELRRMLGVLRRPDTEVADELDPQPGLDQLDALAARASSGRRVSIDRRGEVRPLSAGLELGVYRLVQEALTNSAKHSDATTVDVVVDYGATDLTVDVVDNGRPLVAARVGSGGLGLVGMQERIALLNGELSTGARNEAPGYRVHARLPIDE